MVRTEAVSRAEIHVVPWWLILIEGIAAIILGIMLFASPGATTQVLVQVVGWYWLISGIMAIVSLFMDSHQWGWKLVSGILGIVAGFLIIQNPLWSTFLVPAAFLIVLAISGIVIGIIQLIQAFTTRDLGIGVLGVLIILFGALILFRPSFGATVFLVVFPIVAIVGGIVGIIMAFRVRQIERAPAQARYASAPSAVPVTGEETREGEPHEHKEPPDQPVNPPTE